MFDLFFIISLFLVIIDKVFTLFISNNFSINIYYTTNKFQFNFINYINRLMIHEKKSFILINKILNKKKII